MIPQAEFSRLNSLLEGYLAVQGRQPGEVRRSMMTGCIFGIDHEAVEKKVNLRSNGQRSDR